MQDPKPLTSEIFPSRSLGLFLALTFGLTWGIAGLFMLFPERLVNIFGEISVRNPLFILAVYSPGFAALFLVLKTSGLKGLGAFLRRLGQWRAPWYWWLIVVAGMPLIMFGGAFIKGSLSNAFAFSPWYQALPALLLALLLGPIEELGWRGLALPLLQRRFPPLVAGLLLGLIWALWHLPAFLIGGTPQSAWAFGPYVGGVLAIAMLMTLMFNESGGSLLLPVLLHFQANNPLWPDAQPWDSLLLVVLALVLVVIKRRSLTTKTTGVLTILRGEAAG
ncbi:MAG: hypothetical protein A2087_01350 [Spirochaetes bacterium GWD1_61_31]|nr:MAG: hypothetical protein A2Y37_00285 [Spirochaetes bacterium GWB1_60_80]OHD28908.1 MAG: hypothetical protein A2004_10760 [Spirochaetes bacterium GWC1_61_12]OHD36769.1 MAG: hypothetical protein A2087_01350 [Spirochaetes bacterium GWD1_61_31]OHD43558.1 MAG: hypothetical protein A2Y35_04775 [Spirochaetes bacterium GWE1_60_18]OHD59025.1 MAG: hypothetical protein A2Y32_01970 [Spirochaetes bacterium GWF1_60_12]HAP43578.1 CPBP family intramembrane metalloprotease [Spirochaetaceae bacterium]